MFENIEKALAIMLLATGVKDQTKTHFFLTVTFQRFSKNFQWMRSVYQRLKEHQLNLEAVVQRRSIERCSYKFYKIHKKTPVPESLF